MLFVSGYFYFILFCVVLIAFMLIIVLQQSVMISRDDF